MTQAERVMKYIGEFGSISSWEAFRDLGITRLAARIADLESGGVHFVRTRETVKNPDTPGDLLLFNLVSQLQLLLGGFAPAVS